MEVRPARWDDIDGVVDLLDSRERVAYGQSEVKLVYILGDWQLPSFEVGRDNWVAVEAGRVTGYASVSATQNLVHAAPDAAVGDRLLACAVERSRERGFDALRTIVATADGPLQALVKRHGFVRESEIVRMWKPLGGDDPPPRWPDGVRVRTYEPEDATRVKRLLDDAYLGWDSRYVPMAQEAWERSITGDADFDAGSWWLVEEDGELLGCALNWRAGWVKDLAVREQDRGRGIAKALLLHAAGEFSRRGVTRLGLKVAADNPTGAVQLYERLGFVADRREAVHALWL
jgi:mycothiol synthase